MEEREKEPNFVKFGREHYTTSIDFPKRRLDFKKHTHNVLDGGGAYWYKYFRATRVNGWWREWVSRPGPRLYFC